MHCFRGLVNLGASEKVLRDFILFRDRDRVTGCVGFFW